LFDWLYTAISWVMARWHSLFSLFLDPAGGITWALSIVFLVITLRIILFPLFVKQIKSQRAMQELQPDIARLRKQYGSDRQGLAVAMQALQKERGVNPLAGCLPILPQIPIFFALFHVLRRLAPGKDGLYSWTDELTEQAAEAELFGAPISSQFFMQGDKLELLDLPGVTESGIRVVAFTLMVVMCATTYITQKQIMKRSGPVEGQAAMVQKFLLYVMPASLFVSGFFFPIGVLLYWMTNNLWTLGQQFFVLRRMPPPGSDAAKAKAEAEKPKVDPKTLAPKPGQKPVRAKGPKAATLAPTSTVAADGSPLEAPDSEAASTPVTPPAKAAPATGEAAGSEPAKAKPGTSAGGANGRTPGRSGPAAGKGGSTAASRAKRKRR
jgi:YidC/Oxa1 family membrane protein insertase